MFILDEDYIKARFFMTMSRLGSPTVGQNLRPGEKVVYASMDQLDDKEHDEELVLSALLGKPSTGSLKLLMDLRPQFRTPELRNATEETFQMFDQV